MSLSDVNIKPLPPTCS